MSIISSYTSTVGCLTSWIVSLRFRKTFSSLSACQSTVVVVIQKRTIFSSKMKFLLFSLLRCSTKIVTFFAMTLVTVRLRDAILTEWLSLTRTTPSLQGYAFILKCSKILLLTTYTTAGLFTVLNDLISSPQSPSLNSSLIEASSLILS